MSGVAPVIPKVQFSSASGVPLANGTVTVYIANTTTPTPTWQNKALNILNTNPIQLDSRGEALIWLDPTVVYDFLLKNAGGVTQWTVEDISGAEPAGLTQALAATSGSSLIGYIQSAAGAIARTLQNFLRIGWVNAEDFDTLQHAIDTGRDVRVNAALTLAAPVTISATRQRLRCGPAGVISPNYDGDVIRVTAAGVSVRAFIDGTNQPASGTLGGAIVIGYGGANAQQCSVAWSRVSNFYGDAYLWEQGSMLDHTGAYCYSISRDGFRSTINYDDNNHGYYADTHAINCAGVGYNLLNVGAVSDNLNPRNNVYVNAKAFGCGRNFDIGTRSNVGSVFSEIGTDPDRFGTYSRGNFISVIDTSAALQAWVDDGFGNVLEGINSFDVWTAINRFFTKLTINARHEGYRELSQSGDRTFTDQFSGTTGDVTVTYGKGTASSRTDQFDRMSFRSGSGTTTTVSCNFGTILAQGRAGVDSGLFVTAGGTFAGIATWCDTTNNKPSAMVLEVQVDVATGTVFIEAINPTAASMVSVSGRVSVVVWPIV